MELGGPERSRCDNAGTYEFIANRLSESTTGKVHLIESICAVDNRRRINPPSMKPRPTQPNRRIHDLYVR
jgi:hypothetical protein